MAVKVISGDHVKTVSMVAKKAGLKHWEKAVDVSILGEDIDFDRICEEYDVFARVTPKQKQELVAALKRKGHHVAMTGDGVNDLLALRTADCSLRWQREVMPADRFLRLFYWNQTLPICLR